MRVVHEDGTSIFECLRNVYDRYSATEEGCEVLFHKNNRFRSSAFRKFFVHEEAVQEQYVNARDPTTPYSS